MIEDLMFWLLIVLILIIAFLIFVIVKIQLENNSTLVEIHNMVQEMKNKK